MQSRYLPDFRAAVENSEEREHLRIQKDIRAPTGYQRRREEPDKAKMADSAANLLTEEDNDEFEGILGMMLNSEFDEDVVFPDSPSTPVPVSPITSFVASTPFSAALPNAYSVPSETIQRNSDTVYPAPDERNRPRGSKEFDVSTWV